MSCNLTTTSALDVEVARGSYQSIDFEATQTIDGVKTPINLTGRRVFIFVALNANPSTPTEFFSYSPAANGIDITDEANGKFTWIITDTDSDRQARDYIYSVGHDDGAGGDLQDFKATPKLTITDTTIKPSELP